jgi:hypothetical protein
LPGVSWKLVVLRRIRMVVEGLLEAPGRGKQAVAWKRAACAFAYSLLVVLMIFSGALGFGIRGADVDRMRTFAAAVRGWQTNPDFRDVQREYVTLGVDAMRGRLCGLAGEQVVMGFRSLPGLPPYLSVHESSAAHYRAFGSGEIAAYLHLTSEQGIGDAIVMIEDLARRETLSDADIIAFLRGFKLPLDVVTDGGAIASVRRLLADVEASRPFVVRGEIASRLRSILKPDTIFSDFDDVVKQADIELWRAKQVSDFLAGIWAQGYGQIYLTGIEWMLRIRLWARVIFVIGVALIAIRLMKLRSPAAAATAGHPNPTTSPTSPGQTV